MSRESDLLFGLPALQLDDWFARILDAPRCVEAPAGGIMAGMKIDLELPAGLETREYESARRAAIEGAILCLYRDGAISGGRAARELAMSLEAFLLWASQRGVPVLRATAEELEADAASALDAAGSGQ